MKINLSLLITFLSFCGTLFSQLSTTLTSTPNSVCNGFGCNYSGPSILINEVMLSPTYFDGSIFGDDRGGEWIELYNPDKCNSVDISCFFLGNNAPDGEPLFNYPGGFVIPNNTIIPPNGFCVVRGINATHVPTNLLVQNGGNTIEIVVNASRVCIGGGNRLWFPNAGGWFAFYNRNGVVQDAIYWGDTLNFCLNCRPCNPQGCSYNGNLASFSEIPYSKKKYITSMYPNPGLSYRRMPDGNSWSLFFSIPTIGNCNDTCLTTPSITCNGTATVLVSGGTQPYSYQWHQGYMQTGATATGLCDGWVYVTVSDANGLNRTDSVLVGLMNFEANIQILDKINCYNEKTGKLTANLINGAYPLSYLWNTNPPNENQIIEGLSEGIYQVIITDGNGCKDTASIYLSQPPELLFNVSSTDVICKNDCNGTLNLSANGGKPPYKFYFQNTEITIANTLCVGNYMVQVMDSNNCNITKNVIINYTDDILANFYADPTSGIYPLNVNFLNTTINGYQYYWDFGTGDFSSETSPSYLYSDTGKYNVNLIATSTNGCRDTSKVIINVYPEMIIYIPNAFSPNNDGTNDFFYPVINRQVEKYELFIYNRWGNLVFNSNNQYQKWDGKYQGEIVKEGVYYYIIYITAGNKEKKFHSSLTILR